MPQVQISTRDPAQLALLTLHFNPIFPTVLSLELVVCHIAFLELLQISYGRFNFKRLLLMWYDPYFVAYDKEMFLEACFRMLEENYQMVFYEFMLHT